MARRAYPVYFRVEFTGDAQGMWWEGTVSAFSKDQALILAAVQARDEGIVFTTGTYSTVRLAEESEYPEL